MTVSAPQLILPPAPGVSNVSEASDGCTVFVTLADLSGAMRTRALPSALEGETLAPLMAGAPSNESAAAFTLYPRWREFDNHSHCFKPYQEIEAIGLSVRTAGFRMTIWTAWNVSWNKPALGTVRAIELYDHRSDLGIGPNVFDEFENENLAASPQYAPVVEELRGLLHEQFGRWEARPGPGPDALPAAKSDDVARPLLIDDGSAGGAAVYWVGAQKTGVGAALPAADVSADQRSLFVPPNGKVSRWFAMRSRHREGAAINRADFFGMSLRDRELSVSLDLGGAGCGCKAALYLVAPEQGADAPAGPMNDFYCDGTGWAGGFCPELDLLEANMIDFSVTFHWCRKPYNKANCPRPGPDMQAGSRDQGCGHAHCDPRTYHDYGPNSTFVIDSSKPFRAAWRFDAGPSATSPMRMHLTLRQGAATVTRTTDVPGEAGATALEIIKSMDWKIVALWDKNPGWLDKPTCPPMNYSAGCADMPPFTTFANISLREHQQAPTSAMKSDDAVKLPIGPVKYRVLPTFLSYTWDSAGFCDTNGTIRCADDRTTQLRAANLAPFVLRVSGSYTDREQFEGGPYLRELPSAVASGLRAHNPRPQCNVSAGAFDAIKRFAAAANAPLIWGLNSITREHASATGAYDSANAEALMRHDISGEGGTVAAYELGEP